MQNFHPHQLDSQLFFLWFKLVETDHFYNNITASALCWTNSGVMTFQIITSPPNLSPPDSHGHSSNSNWAAAGSPACSPLMHFAQTPTHVEARVAFKKANGPVRWPLCAECHWELLIALEGNSSLWLIKIPSGLISSLYFLASVWCITHHHIQPGPTPVSDGSGTMTLSNASSKIVERDFSSNLFKFKKKNKHYPLSNLKLGGFNNWNIFVNFSVIANESS